MANFQPRERRATRDAQPAAPATLHSVTAEEAVLGSILINPECLHDVAELVTAQSFYIVRHSFIFEAMLALVDSRAELDFVTVCDALERAGRLEEIGGAAYLAHLSNAVPVAVNATDYARIVRDMATRRALMGAAQAVAQLALDETREVREVVEASERAVFEIAERGGEVAKPMHARDIAAEVLGRAAEWQDNPREWRNLATGLGDLDDALGGIMPGEMIIVAGRPGMGKSTLAFQFATMGKMEDGSKPKTLIFSMEMARSQIGTRLACAHAALDYTKLKRGQYARGSREWERFNAALDNIARLPMSIHDRPCSTREIAAIARRQRERAGIDLVIVDHLGLATDSGYKNDYERVGGISWGLRTLASSVGVPIIVICQMSRASESRADKRPTLSDMRDSGKVEENADKVIALYRENYYDHTITDKTAWAYILKNRDESVADVPLIFDAERTRFLSAQRTPLNQ